MVKFFINPSENIAVPERIGICRELFNVEVSRVFYGGVSQRFIGSVLPYARNDSLPFFILRNDDGRRSPCGKTGVWDSGEEG
jgi:hypothetical protein